MRLSYGTATVIFDAGGNPVGFYDKYDFNKGENGERAFLYETFTTVGNYAGNGSEGYVIKYGIQP